MSNTYDFAYLNTTSLRIVFELQGFHQHCPCVNFYTNIVRNLVLLQNKLRLFTDMHHCLRHFEIKKKGSNSITCNHL